MKKNKNYYLIGLIYVILFAGYNLVIFMLFNHRNNVFWTSYAFMVVAFIAQFITFFLAFKNTNIETIFFGIPLESLSIYYILAELFCSLVFMIFYNISIKIAFSVQILLIGAFVIISIIALMSRDVIQDINQKIKENVSFIKSINVDVEMMMQKTGDAELKSCLKKLSETVKYSDPMTNPTIADVEQRIMQKLSETRVYCDSQQTENAKKACTELELLFIERNKKLLISK